MNTPVLNKEDGIWTLTTMVGAVKVMLHFFKDSKDNPTISFTTTDTSDPDADPIAFTGKPGQFEHFMNSMYRDEMIALTKVLLALEYVVRYDL